MAVEAHTIEIDGSTYTLATLPATKGLEVSFHILAMAGDMARWADPDGAVVLQQAVGALMNRMSDPKTAECVKVLVAGLHKEIPGKPLPGAKVDFDIEFAGNYGTLVRIVSWALQFNFKSFFSGRAELTGLLEQIKSNKAKSILDNATPA